MKRRQDPRIRRILKHIRKIASGFHRDTLKPSRRRDELDAIIVGLNMLAEELDATMVSRQTLKGILSALPVGMLILDSRQRILDLNPAAVRILGGDRDQIVSRSVRTILPRKAVRKTRLDQILRGQGNLTTALSRCGGTRTVRLIGAPLGRTRSRILVMEDISEEIRARETAEHEHSLLKAVIDGTTDAVYIADLDGRYILVNPAGTRAMGKKRSEIVGHTYEELFPAEVARRLRQTDRQVLRTGRTMTFEDTFRLGEKSFTYLTTKGLHRDPRGRVLGTLGIFRNITGLKRAEEDLRESEERFRRLAGITTEGVAIHRKGTILDVNRAFVSMFGYPPSEVVGMNALKLAAPESRPIVRKNMSSGYERPYNAVGLRKDGSTFIGELRGRPIHFRGQLARVVTIRNVTKQREAEGALRESEERLRSVVESTDVLIFQTDRRGRVLFLNRPAPPYTRENVVGRTITEVVPLPFDRRLMRVIRRVCRTGRIEEFEDYGPRTRSWWLLRIAPFRRDGTIAGVTAFGTVITRRKEAEEALQHKEEELRLVTDNAPVLISYVDADHRYQFNNQAYERLYGVPPEELRGRRVADVVGPSNYNRIRRHLEAALSGRRIRFEQVVESGMGDRAMSVDLVPHFGEGRKVLGVTVVAADVTEVREGEERYRRLVENTSDAIYVHDDRGRLLDVNRAACDSTGYSREELLALSVPDVSSVPPKLFRKRLREILQGKRSTFEGTHRRKDGTTFPVEINAGAMELKGRRVILALARDISQRKRVEHAVAASRAVVEAQEAERRRVARELHDGVNQILTSVNLRFQALDGTITAREREELNRLMDSAMREIRAISQGLRPTALDDLGLVAASRNVCREFEARTGLKCRFDTGSGVGRLSKETEVNLYRIIQEALGNVEHHSGATRASVRLGRSGHRLLVMVRDNGRGIRRESRTGMGLINMRERASLLGGTFELGVPRGGGTEIRVTVPR